MGTWRNQAVRNGLKNRGVKPYGFKSRRPYQNKFNVTEVLKMFGNPITTTPMTTEDANQYFTNIDSSSTHGTDISFVATLRALLAERISGDEHVKLRLENFRHRPHNPKRLVDYADINSLSKGDIYIMNITYSKEVADEVFNLAKTAAPTGWEIVDIIEAFFIKSFRVCCLADSEHKRVCLVVENLNYKIWHYLQCSIPAFLPWYFNPEEGISELEMELIKSLRENTSDKYIDIISKIAEKYDFEKARIKRLLGDFESKIVQKELDVENRNISAISQRIRDHNNAISSNLRDLENRRIRVLGLQQKLAESGEESEIMDYFLNNSNIELLDVGDYGIKFASKGYITYFDEEIAKNVIDRSTSYVYRPGGMNGAEYIASDDLKRLMTAIFVDQVLKIKVFAVYELDIENQEVYTVSHSNHYYSDRMPNIHIERYGCLGSYIVSMNEAMANHNYIGAIEQCGASARSLNFADSTVMSEFMRTLYGCTDYNNTCIELPDGSVVDPQGAIKWLKSQEVSDK